ncbi:MAG: LemA family protein [Phycisphaeraceae bacterium]|nr:LemA family protein [Phycisphaeraceae bacterium]
MLGPAAIVILGLTLVVVVPLVVLALIYNRLVTLRVRVANAFSQIDVQLRRRYDLIPNLVSAVQGYMAHERETLEAVIAARANATQAMQAALTAAPGDVAAIGALAAANMTLDGAVGRLFGLVERYPDLKASQNVMQLQEELVSTENRVAFARQSYNDSVMTYNTARQVFPQNLVAGLFGFAESALYQADDSARALPSVKL